MALQHVPRGPSATWRGRRGTSRVSYGTVPMWRQTPEFGFSGTRRTAGKKKVSLTLNLEIRSLERCIFTRFAPYPLGATVLFTGQP